MKTLVTMLIATFLVPVLHAQEGAPMGKSDAGKAKWNASLCMRCHGEQGQGGFGPDLAGRGLSYSQFKRAIRIPWGVMPAFTERQVSDQQIADVQTYLLGLPKVAEPGPWNEKLPPADAPHGQALLIALGCGQCHGPEGQRIREVFGGEASEVEFSTLTKLAYTHTEQFPDGRMGNFSKLRVPEASLQEIFQFLTKDLGFLVPFSAQVKAGVASGANTTYTLTLKNQGKQGKGLTAEGLTVALALAPGTTVVSGTGTGYQGVRSDPELKTDAATWQVPSVGPGEEQNFTLTVSGKGGAPAEVFKGSVVRWTKPEMRNGAPNLADRDPKLMGKFPQTFVTFPPSAPPPTQAER